MSSKFDSLYWSMRLFPSYESPLQNGKMERRYQTLKDIVRSWKGFSSFLIFLWGYVL